MSGLLYPAYQKFYSAISCLNRFCKEQDFFQNIASLDTFFSEYRSITLVMQKSLAHTQHINTYKDLVEFVPGEGYRRRCSEKSVGRDSIYGYIYG